MAPVQVNQPAGPFGMSFMQQEIVKNTVRPCFDGTVAKWRQFAVDWEKYFTIAMEG